MNSRPVVVSLGGPTAIGREGAATGRDPHPGPARHAPGGFAASLAPGRINWKELTGLGSFFEEAARGSSSTPGGTTPCPSGHGSALRGLHRPGGLGGHLYSGNRSIGESYG